MKLLIFSNNCILGFSDAETINSLLDSVVVNLSLYGGRDGCMSMTFSSLSLLSLGGFVGLTYGIDWCEQIILVDLKYDYQLLNILNLGML